MVTSKNQYIDLSTRYKNAEKQKALPSPSPIRPKLLPCMWLRVLINRLQCELTKSIYRFFMVNFMKFLKIQQATVL